MLPAGRVTVDGVQTTNAWQCPECKRTAVTLTGCGWIFGLPVTGGFGLMALALLSRGFRGDEEGMLMGGLMCLFVTFLLLMLGLRVRDAVKNPSIE